MTSEQYYYLGYAVTAVYLVIEYSLKIREKGMKKSVYFSFFVFLCSFSIYMYFFKKLNLVFIGFEGFMFILYFCVFVYSEYVFRVYSLQDLKKLYK
jgi:glucan phosphoethanolaminetransferase (alkaline phosphatase superfamily)